ncbi:UNVERIFIED_CONTAM: hypothetical protein K2H54_030138 [Gekko kuhli]
MRLRYKKVVALNATSGHNAVTCPFYEELDRILAKSRDIYPEAGILQTRPQGRREIQTPTPSSEEASQELFSEGSPTRLHSHNHPQAAMKITCLLGTNHLAVNHINVKST